MLITEMYSTQNCERGLFVILSVPRNKFLSYFVF